LPPQVDRSVTCAQAIGHAAALAVTRGAVRGTGASACCAGCVHD